MADAKQPNAIFRIFLIVCHPILCLSHIWFIFRPQSVEMLCRKSISENQNRKTTLKINPFPRCHNIVWPACRYRRRSTSAVTPPACSCFNRPTEPGDDLSSVHYFVETFTVSLSGNYNFVVATDPSFDVHPALFNIQSNIVIAGNDDNVNDSGSALVFHRWQHLHICDRWF